MVHGRDRTQRPEPVEVFVSYSAVDRPWSERLNRMLRPLEILGSARVFVDTKIVPGSGWKVRSSRPSIVRRYMSHLSASTPRVLSS